MGRREPSKWFKKNWKIISLVIVIIVVMSLLTIFLEPYVAGRVVGWSEDVKVGNWVFNRPAITVDSKNNAHVVWCEVEPYENAPYYRVETYYSKINSAGDIIVDKKKLPTDSGTYHIATDSNNNLHILWAGVGNTTTINEIHYLKLDNNGEIVIADKKIADGFYPGTVIDRFDKIHLTFTYNDTAHYMKLDTSGNILTHHTDIREVSVVPGYRIVADEGGSYIYLGSNGAIDSENNIHLTSESWCNYYYTKLDSDGNILINKTKIADTFIFFENNPVIDIDSKDNVWIFYTIEEEFKPAYIHCTKLDKEGRKLVDNKKLFEGGLFGGSHQAIAIDLHDNIHLIYGHSGIRYRTTAHPEGFSRQATLYLGIAMALIIGTIVFIAVALRKIGSKQRISPSTQYQCQFCGQPLTFSQQYGRWHCYHCQRYAQK